MTNIASEAISVSQKVTLGPHETKLLFTLEARGSDLFSLSEAQEILRIPKQAAADVLYRLRKKGRAVEVRKGSYLLVPARAGAEGGWSENILRVIAAILRDGYYVGFATAMSYWGMTEQVPRIVHVVIPGQRRPFQFQGQRVRFVSLKREHIFGIVAEPLEKGTFNVSDREKTILDGLLFPEYCGGVCEVAKALWASRGELRWARMREHLRRLGVDAVRRRLGYLLDVLEIDTSLRQKLPRDFRGFRWLDPTAPKSRLAYSKDWGLILNLEPAELLAWRQS